jgi:hypothetical protein
MYPLLLSLLGMHIYLGHQFGRYNINQITQILSLESLIAKKIMVYLL